MSDLKLFRTGQNGVSEIEGTAAALEKSLQTLIEANLECFLVVRFLATEFSTGREHGGRMDTLGIDENGCPVIIKYKRSSNANVINLGLFYLDWLMNHNIELIRYVRFGDGLLLLEQVNAVSAPLATDSSSGGNCLSATRGHTKTVTDYLEQADQELTDRYEALREYLVNLGDDVQIKTLKNYFAFKRIKNFACVEVHTRTRNLLEYVKVDSDSVSRWKRVLPTTSAILVISARDSWRLSSVQWTTLKIKNPCYSAVMKVREQ